VGFGQPLGTVRTALPGLIKLSVQVKTLAEKLGCAAWRQSLNPARIEE
jgi:hypothetical protein